VAIIDTVIADYLENALKFERLAAEEHHTKIKAQLEKQAVAYRRLASERASSVFRLQEVDADRTATLRMGIPFAWIRAKEPISATPTFASDAWRPSGNGRDTRQSAAFNSFATDRA
jgi:hypothetical protein